MRLFARLASCLLIALALAGCQPSRGPGGADGGTLTRALTAEPATLDPQGAANSGTSVILPYLFDTLIARQRDGKYVGQLAESWQPSADGLSLDVRLRQGVRFHDGSALDANAVVFTFERFREFGQKSPIYGDVVALAGVSAVDELTVRFQFRSPVASFLSTLAMPYAGILNPSAVRAAGDEFGLRPVGTGPFKLGEWRKGERITLVRNPDYRWGSPEVENRGPVHLSALTFRFIPDASTQLAALKAGEVDVVFVSEPSQTSAVEGDRSLRLEKVDLDSLVYLGYNCARPPFDEVKVRQAFSYAVDKDEIIRVALGGLGVVANTPLSPTLLGYNPELASYGQGHDPEKAKALLVQAGFARGPDGAWQRGGKKLSVKLLTSTRAPNEAVATLLQSQLKVLGVPVEVQQLDSAAVMQANVEGSFDLLLWRHEWSDPSALAFALSTSRIRQTNRVFYSSPQVDALFDQGNRELDPARRSLVYQEAQKIILAESPWQPLYVPVEGMVVRERVVGIKVGALGRMLVNDVKLGG